LVWFNANSLKICIVILANFELVAKRLLKNTLFFKLELVLQGAIHLHHGKGMVIKMNEKIKVLVVDDNPSFCFLASEELKIRNFEVVGTVGDGHTALQYILDETPDVVVLDLILSGINGIGVMSSVAESNLAKKPAFIISTVMSNEYSFKECSKWGASYYLVKPYDFDILALRINGLFPNKIYDNTQINDKDNHININNRAIANRLLSSSKDIDTQVTTLIIDMGIPAHLKGYQYIRTAIMMAIENRDIIKSITKGLYPAVANIHSTTPSRVERAIRNAIEVAWQRGNIVAFHNIFGYTISNERGKPTNSEFVALLAEKIRIENNK